MEIPQTKTVFEVREIPKELFFYYAPRGSTPEDAAVHLGSKIVGEVLNKPAFGGFIDGEFIPGSLRITPEEVLVAFADELKSDSKIKVLGNFEK